MRLLLLTSSAAMLCVALLPLPVAGEVASHPDDTAAEIKRLEHALAQAVVKRDYNALMRIEAATYVYTDSDAKVDTRDDFIKVYKGGTSDVRSLRFDDLV